MWDFLSWGDKVRFGLLAIQTKIKKNWKELEGLDAESWLMKKVGKNVTRKIFENIMREKYGLPLKQISASELASRLKEGEATGRFYYPKCGLHEMVERLAKRIEKNGGIVETEREVKEIKIREGKVEKVKYLEGKKKREIKKPDVVINSSPVPVFLKIAKGLPKTYSQKLSAIKYCKNICVDIVYEEKISDFYWINCFQNVFGGVIEHTNLAPLYPFKFAWIFKYAPSSRIWKLSDQKVARLFIKNLQSMFPHVKVENYFVFRDTFASPLYDINYAKYMPEIETPVKNLFFTGVSTTYPEIRTMNTAFKAGMRTAESVMEKFPNI
jgi:protoporphyrinogen oxidase